MEAAGIEPAVINSQVISQQQLVKNGIFESVNNYVSGSHSKDIDGHRLAPFVGGDVDRDVLNRAIYIAKHWPTLPSHVRDTITALVDQFGG